MIYPFVEKPCEIEELNDSTIMKAYREAEKGNLKPLKDMYKSRFGFGHEHLVKGYYKLGGWFFDLSDFCKDYLVKDKNGSWTEYTTPNKTCLYNMIGRHNVVEIIER
ncbi:hypothetical protein ACWKTZ_20945 [Bacillus cereus]